MTGSIVGLAGILLFGYLLGSIPFGYLAGKAKGIDIRKQGSGNIGATNVFRVLGRPWGISVFFGDAAKGYFAVVLSLPMFFLVESWLVNSHPLDSVAPVYVRLIAAIGVILGHSFPVWLRFKGGKGVATTAGVMLGLVPPSAFTALVVWTAVFYATRYVSVASLVAATALPVAVYFFSRPEERWPLFLLNLAISLLVFWRHRTNIQRLMAGTENRFVKKKNTE